MRIQKPVLAIAMAGAAALASGQEREPEAPRCPESLLEPCAGPQHEQLHQRDHDRRETVRVWDPNLAQWRVEHPRKVWDPNLAQYRYERRDEVWDPYLARYRPRDARTDPPPPERASEGRRRASRRR